MNIRRVTCKTCTYEWDGYEDEVCCPFCNSNHITPHRLLIKRKCNSCAFVWPEIGGASPCPICLSPHVSDYIGPSRFRCISCSHQFITEEDYPLCPTCGKADIYIDYDPAKRFDLFLESPGQRIPQIIATIADLCTIDTASAADMIERCPLRIMEDLGDKDAMQLIMRLEDMGATVTVIAVEGKE